MHGSPVMLLQIGLSPLLFLDDGDPALGSCTPSLPSPSDSPGLCHIDVGPKGPGSWLMAAANSITITQVNHFHCAALSLASSCPVPSVLNSWHHGAGGSVLPTCPCCVPVEPMQRGAEAVAPCILAAWNTLPPARIPCSTADVPREQNDCHYGQHCISAPGVGLSASHLPETHLHWPRLASSFY